MRRHGQAPRWGPRRWFGRRAEWMEHAADIDLTEKVVVDEARLAR